MVHGMSWWYYDILYSPASLFLPAIFHPVLFFFFCSSCCCIVIYRDLLVHSIGVGTCVMVHGSDVHVTSFVLLLPASRWYMMVQYITIVFVELFLPFLVFLHFIAFCVHLVLWWAAAAGLYTCCCCGRTGDAVGAAVLSTPLEVWYMEGVHLFACTSFCTGVVHPAVHAAGVGERTPVWWCWYIFCCQAVLLSMNGTWAFLVHWAYIFVQCWYIFFFLYKIFCALPIFLLFLYILSFSFIFCKY